MGAFGVRHVIAHSGGYEERVTLWEAASEDQAIALAEAEAADYATKVDGRSLGLFQSYRLADPAGQGREVFSLIRSSDLAPDEYFDAFFDTGDDRQRVES
jgi:hypothetical protein